MYADIMTCSYTHIQKNIIYSVFILCFDETYPGLVLTVTDFLPVYKFYKYVVQCFPTLQTTN